MITKTQKNEKHDGIPEYVKAPEYVLKELCLVKDYFQDFSNYAKYLARNNGFLTKKEYVKALKVWNRQIEYEDMSNIPYNGREIPEKLESEIKDYIGSAVYRKLNSQNFRQSGFMCIENICRVYGISEEDIDKIIKGRAKLSDKKLKSLSCLLSIDLIAMRDRLMRNTLEAKL